MPTTTIYGVYLGTELRLKDARDDIDGDPVLEVTADVGDLETTVALNAFHVKELRLALQRWEKTQKAQAR